MGARLIHTTDGRTVPEDEYIRRYVAARKAAETKYDRKHANSPYANPLRVLEPKPRRTQ